MGKDVVSGNAGDDELFGGPARDVVKGGPGGDTLVGNLGSDTLLGGIGDDRFLGDNPAPGGPSESSSHDVCNGQQGTDFAVENTCERLSRIESTGPFPQEP
jgi:Ca2+-binding RTX toxin-like protein